MSDEELKARLAIADRLAAATQAGDARKAEAYAACFTEDGVLALEREIAGRAELRAFMTAPSPMGAPSERPMGHVSHHLTTCKIDLTGPDTAKARTYWLVTSPAGIDHNGYYDDVLHKVGGEWLIALRRPRTLWFSPDSMVRR